MSSVFWTEALTPTGLGVGLLLVMVGVLVDHVLARVMKKKDDAIQAERDQKERDASQREAIISGIVDKYISISGPDNGPDILKLITAGATRAADTQLLLEIAERIKHHGKPDPLRWVRTGLSEAELLPFIRWQASRCRELMPFYNIPEWEKHITRFREELGGQHALAE